MGNIYTATHCRRGVDKGGKMDFWFVRWPWHWWGTILSFLLIYISVLAIHTSSLDENPSSSSWSQTTHNIIGSDPNTGARCNQLNLLPHGYIRKFTLHINQACNATFPMTIVLRTDMSHCLFYTNHQVPPIIHQKIYCLSNRSQDLQSISNDLHAPTFQDSLRVIEGSYNFTLVFCLLSFERISGKLSLTLEHSEAEHSIVPLDSLFSPPSSFSSIPLSYGATIPPRLSEKSVGFSIFSSPSSIISVTSLLDSSANISHCDPALSESSTQCNLRSAFAFCNSSFSLSANVTCQIELPVSGHLFMNKSLGPNVVMADSGVLIVNGNGCQISTLPSPLSSNLVIVFPIYSGHSTLSFRMKNCSVNNFGERDEYDSYYGGAIALQSIRSVHVAHMTFHSNWGGAILVASITDSIDLVDCIFINNTGKAGGAIIIDSTPGGIITITRCHFSNNSATHSGGAILFSTDNKNIYINNCIFQLNFSPSGGAIAFTQYNSHIVLSATSFIQNYASRESQGEGGAILFGEYCSHFEISYCTFDGNSAYISGSIATRSTNRNISIFNSSFTNGVSDFQASVVTLSGSHIFFSNCLFSNNSVLSMTFGALSYLINTEDVTFQNCKFTKNTVVSIRTTTSNRNLQLLDCTFLSPLQYPSVSLSLNSYVTARVSNCTFIGGVSDIGSAISGTFTGSLTISKSRFSSLQATRGGALYVSSSSPISILECYFEGNRATETGGAIYIGDSTDVVVWNCSFIGNSAMDSGGAIYKAPEGNLYISSSVFEDNFSEVNGGGAISSEYGNYISITSCKFTNNIAGLGAGGVELLQHHTLVIIVNTTFLKNKSVQSGMGGLWIGNNNENIQIINCDFIENSGFESGGLALGSDNLDITLENLYFRGNIAFSTGGAMSIGNRNVDFYMSGCYFLNNVSPEGGGLAVESDNDVTIFNSSFTLNYAGSYGGAISIQTMNYILVNDTVFEGNNAEDGGALFMYSDNIIRYANTLISANIAKNRGGGIYIGFQNLFESDSLSVYGNIAKAGGGIYIQSRNYWITITSARFVQNVAIFFGGGMYIQDSNIDVSVTGSIIGFNVAGQYGGGIMLQSSNYFFQITNTLMFGNSAVLAGGSLHSSLFNQRLEIKSTVIQDSKSDYGGTLYLGNDHGIVKLQNVQIIRSSALFGGAIYVSPFNEKLILENCSFVECHSANEGGVMYSLAHSITLQSCTLSNSNSPGLFHSGSEILISNSLFQNITSTLSPFSISYGSLAVVGGDILSIHNSTFRQNFADFGAVSARDVKNISIQVCRFTECTGNVGGAISVSGATDISILFTILDFNSAKSGGAIRFESCKNISMVGNRFFDNHCTSTGGAVSVYSSTLVVKECIFTRNVAVQAGSSLYLVNSASVLFSNNFTSNVVEDGAGSVFWLKSSMQEPEGLTSPQFNYFSNNIASYGPNWATEGYKLITPSKTYNITSYGVAIPVIFVSLLDGYDQVVNTDSSTILDVSVASMSQTCYNAAGYATGGLTETLADGLANFSSLQVYCAPGYSLPLEFEVLSDSRVLVASVDLYFRDCVRGEYYSAQECVPCETGTYSLDDDKSDLSKMSQISVCKSCPPHTSRCEGSELYLQRGYWRISPNTDIILACPYGESGCMGGNLTGDASCDDGYEGPLCAVCSSGYALKSSTMTCVPCSNSSGLDIVDILLLSVFGSLLLCVVYYFSRPEIRSQIKSLDDFVLFVMTKLRLVDMNNNQVNKKELLDSIKQFSRRLRARLRVYVTMYQILSVLPFVLDLAFPSPVSLIISGLNFINISISSSSVVSCSTFSYDFIDSLLADTIYPIVAVVLLFSVRWIHLGVVRWRVESQSDFHSHATLESRFSNISSTYFTVFLIFTYLILPSVVTKIFQTFSCQDVDPDDAVSGSDTYMTADYQVPCDSDKYRFGFIWACIMIFVYPVGCPAYYFYLLYDVRHDLLSRDEDIPVEKVDEGQQVSAAVRMKQHKLLSLRFLYESYHPRYWWWEIAETSQRLLLTGVLVLIAQGSAIQIIVGALLTLTFLHLYARYEPFSDGFVLSIKIISFWQIFFVFWIALLIKADFPSISSHFLGVCLVFTVFWNLLVDLCRVCWTAFSSISSFSLTPGPWILRRSVATSFPPKDPAVGSPHGFMSQTEMREVSREKMTLPCSSHPSTQHSSVEPAISPIHQEGEEMRAGDSEI